MKIFLAIFLTSGFLYSCSNQPCKIEERTDLQVKGDEKVSSAKKDLSGRIFVAKPDGSLQCGMGNKTDVNDMKKELGKIEVFSSENKHDGMMRIQVCGHPTGFFNVYEIDKKNLDEALKLGFKLWARD